MNWEWYQDSKMVHLFMHLLFNANFEDKKWKGIPVKRGQFISGLNALHLKTGISIQSIRTCLKRLEDTGEINKQTNNQYSVITINNYDSYQLNDDDSNKQSNKRSTSDQQASNKQSTTTKNNKNEKEFKEEILSYSNEYDNFILKDFFNYWSEWNKSETKMRWQLEKTWQTGRRLSTWFKRSKDFKKPVATGRNPKSEAAPKGYGERSPTAVQRSEFKKSQEE